METNMKFEKRVLARLMVIVLLVVTMSGNWSREEAKAADISDAIGALTEGDTIDIAAGDAIGSGVYYDFMYMKNATDTYCYKEEQNQYWRSYSIPTYDGVNKEFEIEASKLNYKETQYTLKRGGKKIINYYSTDGSVIGSDTYPIIYVYPKAASETATTPSSSLAEGSYKEAQQLTLSASQNADIFYTLDGSEPDITSNKYDAAVAIPITETTTLKAVAYEEGKKVSACLTCVYSILKTDQISISPTSCKVEKGKTKQFTSTVTLLGGDEESFKVASWSVSGNNSTGTKVENGLLSVDPDETANEITVIAKSFDDKTAEAVVSLINLINPVVSLADWSYGDKESEPTLIGNTGNAEVVYSYKKQGAEDSTYTEKVPKDAGQYTLKAEVKENGYYAGNVATCNFKIEPKTIGIKWENTKFTYDGAEHKPTATATGLLENDSCVITVKGGQKEASDTTYTATATELSNPNYKLPTQGVTVAFTIIKKINTIKVTNLELSKKDISLVEGNSDTLKVNVIPSNATNKEVVWKSSNTKVATVSSNGEVTAIKSGKTVITVTAADGSLKESSCTVTVNEAISKKQKVAVRVKAYSRKIKVSWAKIEDADGYYVYGAKCGSDMKKLKTIKNSSTTTWTHTGLKKGEIYKYKVIGYKQSASNTKRIVNSIQLHIATSGSKYTNAKSVKTSFTSKTMKKGKSKQIKAYIKKEDKKKPLVDHVAKLRYIASNTKVATVSSTGEIKAIGKGICYIYVYANNGVYKKIIIKVK